MLDAFGKNAAFLVSLAFLLAACSNSLYHHARWTSVLQSPATAVAQPGGVGGRFETITGPGD